MDVKKNYSFLYGGMLLFGIILACTSMGLAVNVQSQKEEFFDDHDFHCEEISVNMRDGVDIHGLVYFNKNSSDQPDSSIPMILLLPGINSRKEFHFNKVFQLIKRGYAVVTIEQRGHGESEGRSSFIKKEVKDMQEILDFLECDFSFMNISHTGLYGFSYGAGIGSILQAIDDRIYASVFYHPLSSIKGLTQRIPFDSFLGVTPAIDEYKEIDDAFTVCTPNNTKNVLFIHGQSDTMIPIEQTRMLYDHINGSQRQDILLKERPNLNHGENEDDETSLKYSIAWLESFFHQEQFDLDNSDEIKNIETFPYILPSGFFARFLCIIAFLIIFISLSFLILPFRVWPISKMTSRDFERCFESKRKNPRNYWKMISLRIVAYIVPVIGGGFLFSVINPSYAYGYFLVIPLVTMLLLAFIKRHEYDDIKTEWNHWYWFDFKILLWEIPAVVLPGFLFVLCFIFISSLMLLPIIPFFTYSSLLYFLMTFSVSYVDYMLIRGWEYKHSLLLIGLRPMTLFIYFLFVPLPLLPLYPFNIFSILPYLAIIFIGITSWTFLFLIEKIWEIYRNKAIS
ncbi:MAG: alpha/beta hydrolase family protein, partial [Promethearchaeia archaeon]